jgi:peptide chain release factor 3
VRAGREMKLANVLTFMANERVIMEDGVAGDIVGIHNHGQLQIGDTLTEGENLGFKGIPYFSPEMFRAARLRDPLKSKQLQKGLQELGEEGAIQVFELEGGQMLLGAVGVLQFEIVAQRLKDEYKVDAIFEPADIHTARWLTFPDDVTRRNFEREQALRLGKDIDGNPVYLATSRYNLEVTAEKWPKVTFHATREHGRRLMALSSSGPWAVAGQEGHGAGDLLDDTERASMKRPFMRGHRERRTQRGLHAARC